VRTPDRRCVLRHPLDQDGLGLPFIAQIPKLTVRRSYCLGTSRFRMEAATRARSLLHVHSQRNVSCHDCGGASRALSSRAVVRLRDRGQRVDSLVGLRDDRGATSNRLVRAVA
jgi:hypothetical protein